MTKSSDNITGKQVMRIVCCSGIFLFCMIATGCAVSSKQTHVVRSPPQLGSGNSEVGAGSRLNSLDEVETLSKEQFQAPRQFPVPVSQDSITGSQINLPVGTIDTSLPFAVSDANESSSTSNIQASESWAGASVALLVETQATTSVTVAKVSHEEPILLTDVLSLLDDSIRDNPPPLVLPLLTKEERIRGGQFDGIEELVPPSLEISTALQLQDVIDSVYTSYPMLAAAFLSRSIADGELLSSSGAFDLKLKGGGTTGPLGFYRTNRFGAGASQPLFSGGEIFGGYKIGRGNFQPWFGGRESNDGGEFSAGIAIPLAQNREIDPRRAALYRATFGRDAVEPDIQAQIISFVWESSYAYWKWVAAGRNYKIALSLLEIAQERNAGLVERVAAGDLKNIALTDNQRLIVSREAALIDATRKLQQAAIKLSLFLRTLDGQPIIPSAAQLPGEFPDATPINFNEIDADIQIAMANRPELVSMEFLRRQLDVDLNQARNLYLPKVDGALFVSKDVGGASSSKRDKTPFEFEASLQVSVPLQRRKALGKIQSIEGKLSQLSVKIRFTQDKISTDVQGVYAALRAAFQRITKAEESLDFARIMEQAERDRFDLGDSDLLKVNLREKATASAAKTVLQARLDYFQAQADYRAAMALDINPKDAPQP